MRPTDHIQRIHVRGVDGMPLCVRPCIDLIYVDGNVREHVVRDEMTTLCGRRMDHFETQAPLGNQQCGTCLAVLTRQLRMSVAEKDRACK